MYDKILVPTDGSENAIRALFEAIKIAKVTGDGITLIHVYPAGSSVVMSSKQSFYAMMQSKGKMLLENEQKVVEAKGIQVDTLLIEGDAAEQIVKAAKEGNFGLIVIGARGMGKLTELFVGSVSQAVIKNAPCPVLVTK